MSDKNAPEKQAGVSQADQDYAEHAAANPDAASQAQVQQNADPAGVSQEEQDK